MSTKINWDALGVGTSVACAIHCAVLPLVMTSFPIFGINILENSRFEYFMIFLAFCIGTFSLWHGYKKHHQRIIPLLFFTSGILLLFAKQRWHAYELLILPFAVACIILAHFVNFRMCKITGHNARQDARVNG